MCYTPPNLFQVYSCFPTKVPENSDEGKLITFSTESEECHLVMNSETCAIAFMKEIMDLLKTDQLKTDQSAHDMDHLLKLTHSQVPQVGLNTYTCTKQNNLLLIFGLHLCSL